MRTGTAFVVGLSLVSGLAFLAPEPPAARSAEETAVGPRADADLRAAAVEFVRSLSEAEREKALRPLDHGERTKWYFARGGREGLFLRDMDGGTRAATLALVDGFLSVAGREQ